MLVCECGCKGEKNRSHLERMDIKCGSPKSYLKPISLELLSFISGYQKTLNFYFKEFCGVFSSILYECITVICRIQFYIILWLIILYFYIILEARFMNSCTSGVQLALPNWGGERLGVGPVGGGRDKEAAMGGWWASPAHWLNSPLNSPWDSQSRGQFTY